MSVGQYTLSYVFWGRNLPKISVYNGALLVAQWQFSKYDNFRMSLKCLRILDSEDEMEDGAFRQRIRGYRLYATFSINMIKNRAMLMFVRKLFFPIGDKIILTPHDDSMRNPIDNTCDFRMIMDSDFEPEYFDGRFIGHAIEFTLKSLNLLPAIPHDRNVIRIIEARTMRSGGVTMADPQFSMTFWSEKMYYGGWEVSSGDLDYVAFWEQPEDPDDIELYGKFW